MARNMAEGKSPGYEKLRSADPDATVSPMDRFRQFSLGDEIFSKRIVGGEEVMIVEPLPFFPPQQKVFDLFFFWQLWNDLAKASLRKDVPLVALRNLSYAMNDVYGHPVNVNFFGDVSKKYVTWTDLSRSLIDVGHPVIHLSFLERMYLTLEEPGSCRCAKVWFYVVMAAAVANLTMFILPETTIWLLAHINLEAKEDQVIFTTLCMVVFSMDYLGKFFCSPFIRDEVVAPSEKHFDLDEAMRSSVPQGKVARCLNFALQPSNVIDLLAVLPWWLDLCVGRILPGAAFLRIIRISRIFHLFKSARYFDMVQVLGLTLWKSMNLVGIVFALITVVGLFAACLLQQTEASAGEAMSEVFLTVPGSWFWIFCRLIGLKDTDDAKGKVESFLGIAVLAVTLTLKGVLWIVPIARIRQIFSQEYALVVNSAKARTKMVADLKSSKAGQEVESRYGCTCAHLLLLTQAGGYEAWVALPLQCSHEEGVEFESTVALGDKLAPSAPSITVKIAWQPRPEMSESQYSLPRGTLELKALKGERLPSGRTDIVWEVPVDTFRSEERRAALQNGSTDKLKFEVNWQGTGEDDNPRVIDEDLQMDYHVYQKQVLNLLEEQSELIQEQKQCLEQQSERLHLLENR
mmetsp:Transcript_72498/g.169869  ORF Transcript_72498/g.169869 Transcript_72498/m.169869 type:complete len:631 (-) Transcript_72498:292-2184(-)